MTDPADLISMCNKSWPFGSAVGVMMPSWLASMVTCVGAFVESSKSLTAVDEDPLELFEHPTMKAVIKIATVMKHGMRIKSNDVR